MDFRKQLTVQKRENWLSRPVEPWSEIILWQLLRYSSYLWLLPDLSQTFSVQRQDLPLQTG
jgi:hypothetical protein